MGSVVVLEFLVAALPLLGGGTILPLLELATFNPTMALLLFCTVNYGDMRTAMYNVWCPLTLHGDSLQARNRAAVCNHMNREKSQYHVCCFMFN
jgi:hypothetical protein